MSKVNLTVFLFLNELFDIKNIKGPFFRGIFNEIKKKCYALTCFFVGTRSRQVTCLFVRSSILMAFSRVKERLPSSTLYMVAADTPTNLANLVTLTPFALKYSMSFTRKSPFILSEVKNMLEKNTTCATLSNMRLAQYLKTSQGGLYESFK
jgi:hypothetical protein